MSDRRDTAKQNRRRSLRRIAAGLVLLVVGVVLMGSGTGQGPRETWFATANWADWVGGLVACGGAFLLVEGWLRLRNG